MTLLRFIAQSILASGVIGLSLKVFGVVVLLRLARLLIRAWVSMGKK